jgi:transcriptional regulator with XRE-family HTH domain
MQDLHERWAKRLDGLMTAGDVSNRRMARECGVHISTIGRVRTGDITPTDELKWRICGVLGMSLDEVFPWPMVVPPHPSTFVAGAEPARAA